MRLLHSADWQLGLKAGQVGDLASAVREQRFETAERVVQLARDREVDLVLLAGDTFDGLDVTCVDDIERPNFFDSPLGPGTRTPS